MLSILDYMDVSCNRCGTEYEFEETLVSDSGTTVKCTSCGHLFKVFRPGQSPETIDRTKPWLIRKTDGTVEPLISLGDLTRLITKGVYTADDEISRTGQVWKRFGDIAELRGFLSSSRRRQDQKDGPLALGATAAPTKDTEMELPVGVAPRDQPRLARTDPLEPIPPEKAERQEAKRIRRNTPSMWGTTPEVESTREQSEMIKRQLASRDAAGSQQPPEAALSGSMDPGRQTVRDEGAEVGGKEEQRDSDQQLPSVKVSPVESEASDPASAGEKPAVPSVAKIPVADGEERPAAIAQSRIGWLVWIVLGLLVLGVGGLLWSMNLPAEEASELALEERSDRLIRRGQYALDSHRIDRFSESITEFTKALAFRDRDPGLLALLSRAYAIWAQSMKFRIMDAEASGDEGADPELAALRYEVQNYTDRAMQYAERAARYSPDSLEALIASSDALRLNGDLEDARVYLEKARTLAQSPSSELLRVEAMIGIDVAGGDLKAGLQSAKKAVAGAPESIRLRLLLARCLMAVDERDDALAQLEAVLSQDPEHPETAALKNKLEDRAGSEQVGDAGQEVEESAEVAERSEPERDDSAESVRLLTVIRRGERVLQRGAIARAQKLFGLALEKRPDEPRALTGMGWVEIKKKRPTKALSYFLPAAKQGYPKAFLGLGYAYRKLGRKLDSLSAYESYLQLRPRGRSASIAKTRIEQYRIEMRKKAGRHRLKDTKPSRSRKAGR